MSVTAATLRGLVSDALSHYVGNMPEPDPELADFWVEDTNGRTIVHVDGGEFEIIVTELPEK